MKTTPKLLVPFLLMIAVIGIVSTGPKATAQQADPQGPRELRRACHS